MLLHPQNPDTKRKLALFAAILLIAGGILYFEKQKPMMPPASAAENIAIQAATTPATTGDKASATDRSAILKHKAATYESAKELAQPTGFINTDAFKLADLIGKKVILVDFWTYSCINCQRTIPHLKEWYAKYQDKGFTIVAVHTPEFDFEKQYANVVQAVKDAGIEYPVVLDSNYGTWTAYGNQYWPREYLIDIDGYIVEDHIGEGGYDETEKNIQAALTERAKVLGLDMAINEPITAPSLDDIQTASPETYFGSSRNEFLANGTPGKAGEQYFAEPQTVKSNMLYLIGQWNIMPEYAVTSTSVGSPEVGSDRIDYKYQAKRLYFVAGASEPVEVEVLRDSKPLEASYAGADIHFKNGRSYVTIDANRLYKLIEDSTLGTHLLELVIPKGGLEAFTFTFG